VAHVVCEPCWKCEKDRRAAPCVDACPTRAFYTVGWMNVIDPAACDDCLACVPRCPQRAIFHEDVVPDEWQPYVTLNYLIRNHPAAVHCPPQTSQTECPGPTAPPPTRREERE
jgi:ferredoxin